jgi:NADPH-dependent 2,4-dienoyl-CoA reductase/sulfur reductase-like enzyme
MDERQPAQEPGAGAREPAGTAAGGGEPGLVRFSFDGQELTAPSGATVAAGLLANGVRALRSTRRQGRRRGLFCGIGNCFDCLVDVEGDAAAQRACRRVLAGGDRVYPATPEGAARAAGAPGAAHHHTAERRPAGGITSHPPWPVGETRAALVVVGAGPAGMAASLTAADLGCEVVLVDAGPSLGGQIHRQPELRTPGSDGAGDPGGPAGAGSVSARLPRRFHRLAGHPRVRRLHGATVWAAEPIGGGDVGHPGRFRLRVEAPGGPVVLDAAAVVIATGAVELALPFPGWDLPGVVTAGAAQALLKGQGVLAGRRVLVAGSGPFLLPVAAGLARAGARVVALCEATGPGALTPARLAALARHPGKLREAAAAAATLARHRVPLRLGHGVIACDGDGRVERATIARLDRDWRPLPGSERRVEVDAVCAGHGFVPDLALVRALGCEDRPDPAWRVQVAVHDGDLAATRRGVFVAGEVTGIGGGDVAELEGRLAGLSAARHLGLIDHPAHQRHAARVRGVLTRARRFAGLLAQLYPIGPAWDAWLTPETIACRCEDTTWAQVERALAGGADDLRAIKGVTRCGMGYCQGRVCGPPLRLAVAARTGRPVAEVGDFHTRTINIPIALGALAEPD